MVKYKLDIDGDGRVSEEELKRKEEIIEFENKDLKEDQLRKMAWIAMLSMVVFTAFLFFPIVPIDTINIDKININNNKFTYNDGIYSDFELKILIDHVELYITKYNKVCINCEQLMNLLIQLEKKLNITREKYYKYINISFTKKSNISLIPTKISNKEKIMIKTSDEFIKQIKLYFPNKFDNISACGNIIIIPKINTYNDIISVWFEIYFGEIYHSMCYVKSSMIYKNLYSNNNININNNNKIII
jgi:hypothetical protein